jgi:hypothetical protein
MVAMRPYFISAATALRDSLDAKDDQKTLRKREIFDACIKRVAEKPQNILGSVLGHIEDHLKKIANGDAVKLYGLSEDAVTSICMIPRLQITRLFILAFRDDAFSDEDLVKETENIFLALPGALDNIARKHNIDKKDAVTKAIFHACCDGLGKDIADIRRWMRLSLGYDLMDTLPAPINAQKQTGPVLLTNPA